MSDQYILQDGHPVKAANTLEWARWYETADKERQVARTVLPGDVRVSTVFLGLDHSFGEGPPILYETLVFGGSLDGEMERYHTREEAEAGHKLMVERATEGGAS